MQKQGMQSSYGVEAKEVPRPFPQKKEKQNEDLTNEGDLPDDIAYSTHANMPGTILPCTSVRRYLRPRCL